MSRVVERVGCPFSIARPVAVSMAERANLVLDIEERRKRYLYLERFVIPCRKINDRNYLIKSFISEETFDLQKSIEHNDYDDLN